MPPASTAANAARSLRCAQPPATHAACRLAIRRCAVRTDARTPPSCATSRRIPGCHLVVPAQLDREPERHPACHDRSTGSRLQRIDIDPPATLLACHPREPSRGRPVARGARIDHGTGRRRAQRVEPDSAVAHLRECGQQPCDVPIRRGERGRLRVALRGNGRSLGCACRGPTCGCNCRSRASTLARSASTRHRAPVAAPAHRPAPSTPNRIAAPHCAARRRRNACASRSRYGSRLKPPGSARQAVIPTPRARPARMRPPMPGHPACRRPDTVAHSSRCSRTTPQPRRARRQSRRRMCRSGRYTARPRPRVRNTRPRARAGAMHRKTPRHGAGQRQHRYGQRAVDSPAVHARVMKPERCVGACASGSNCAA